LGTMSSSSVPKSSVFEDFELEHTFPAIGRRVMLLNARKLQAGHHGELLVLAMEDVTERRRAEEEVAKAKELGNNYLNNWHRECILSLYESRYHLRSCAAQV